MMKSSASKWGLVLAGLLVILILVPRLAEAQWGPALAPYPFKVGLTPPPTRVSFLCDIEGAHLYIDGAYKGVLPLPDLQLTVGEHTVLIMASGHYTYETSIKVPAVVHKRYKAVLMPIKQLIIRGPITEQDASLGKHMPGHAIAGLIIGLTMATMAIIAGAAAVFLDVGMGGISL